MVTFYSPNSWVGVSRILDDSDDGIPEAPTLGCDFSLPQFRSHWSRGIPVIVKDVSDQFQGSWGPEYFIEQYGTQKVTIKNCETNTCHRSTVAHFFRYLGTPNDRTNILKLKVRHLCSPWNATKSQVFQDWPPQAHFSSEFPELHNAFLDAVPCPDIARSDGVLNLASHFPLNGIVPDLGVHVPFTQLES
jgi:hypothetical protein